MRNLGQLWWQGMMALLEVEIWVAYVILVILLVVLAAVVIIAL